MAQFNGTSGDDIFTGGNDNDTAVGNGGNDSLSGNGGSDLLVGGTGADTLNGGDGDDTLYSGNESPAFNLPYYGNPYTPPVLDTGIERDILNGGEGSDRIFAGYGDDVDGGGNGSFGDYLFISFLGAPSGVTVDFGLTSQTIGGGTITGIENISWVQGSNFDDVMNVRSTGSGYSDFTAVFGMGGNDQLTAGYYTGVLDGGDGDDVVDGRGSQYLQAVYGGAGNDTLYTNSNTFGAAYGGSGDDTIYSHGETHGGEGNDRIVITFSYYGGRVYGEEGNDVIDASPSGSQISGGSGADTINGNSQNDGLGSADFAAPGSSTTFADDLGTEQDTIAGFGGDDMISAGFGDNVDGGVGNDTLRLSLAGASAGITLNTGGIGSGGSVTLAGGTIQNIENFEYLRGTNFADTLELATQTTLLTVDAGAGDDDITSFSSSVAVSGGDGNDIFAPGAASATFNGGNGSDTVDFRKSAVAITAALDAAGAGSAGTASFSNVENLFGTGLADILSGNASANELRGQDGDDRLTGFGGNDTLDGGAGNDALDGGAGADVLRGGTGNDVYFADASDTIVENAGEGTDEIVISTSYTLGAAVENLTLGGTASVNGTGNSAANVISGNSGANLLAGLDGNDQLSGFDGNDRLEGGNGDDILSGGDGNDLLLGGVGADALYGGAGIDTISYADTAQGVTAYLNGGGTNAGGAAGDVISEAENLTGTALDDVLVGDDADNVFVGGAGNDQIDGRGGFDTVDYSQEAGGNDVIINLGPSTGLFPPDPFPFPSGTARDTFGNRDTLTSIEHLITGSGNDIVIGSSAVETIETGAGNDSLQGSGGDTLIGGSGNDSYGYSAGDIIIELADGGIDNVISSLSNFSIENIANVENMTGSVNTGQTLTGNALDNFIQASGGNDNLFGGGGNDTLAPGAGVDTMTGGSGVDTFVGAAASLNGDTITDLSVGERIRISNATLDGFTFSLSGNTLTFTGGSLTLGNLPAGRLVASAAPEGGVQLTLLPNEARNDINGDVRSDFLVRDAQSGWLTDWLSSATGSFASNSSNVSIQFPLDWKVVGTGDYNGDGRDDMLLRSDAGWLTNWLGTANGGLANNGANSSLFFGPEWKVAGNGDFNGDGKADLLLRRDDGWLTNWLGTANGSFTNNGANTSLFFTNDWKVASTGDFNGDGFTDLLLRRDDGWVTNWLGTANGGFTNNGANTALFFTTDWKVIGTGDINGDGKDDLVIRRDDGWITDWLGTSTGGFTNNGANTALFLTTDWKVSSIADFNGDGHEDLLLRNDSGWMTNWLGTTTGSFANNGANFSTFIAPNWTVQDPFM